MDPTKLEQLEKLLHDGYEFRFSEYIGKGYDLYKQNVGGYIGFLLVSWIIGVFAGEIPVIGTIAYTLVLSPVIMVGGFIVAHKIDKKEIAEFADFFKGFEHIPHLFVATIAMSAIFVIFGFSFLQVYWDMLNGDATAILNYNFTIVSFLVFIPIIYLAVSWTWTNMFIVFYDMPFWDAMEMSRKLITKNWIEFFGFQIVCALITMAGFLLLGVGVLLTYPIAICAQYAAFADVTQLLQETDEDDIERHLIV